MWQDRDKTRVTRRDLLNCCSCFLLDSLLSLSIGLERLTRFKLGDLHRLIKRKRVATHVKRCRRLGETLTCVLRFSLPLLLLSVVLPLLVLLVLVLIVATSILLLIVIPTWVHVLSSLIRPLWLGHLVSLVNITTLIVTLVLLIAGFVTLLPGGEIVWSWSTRVEISGCAWVEIHWCTWVEICEHIRLEYLCRLFLT